MKKHIEYYNKNAGHFYEYKITKKGKTKYQKYEIGYSREYGKVLILDNMTQIVEKNEYEYHELITHPVFMTRNSPIKHKINDVLVIGGGDGGVIRELYKHNEINSITLVELDEDVIKLTSKYFPDVCKDVFINPKTKIIIDDGLSYVEKAISNNNKFVLYIFPKLNFYSKELVH